MEEVLKLLQGLLVLALSCTPFASANDSLRSVYFHGAARGSGEIGLVLNVPARFPLGAGTVSVDFKCGEGVVLNPYSMFQDRWPEWVDLYSPVITPNLITFGGYAIGCDEDWQFFQAPSIEALMDRFQPGGAVDRYVWGVGGSNRHRLPHPALGFTGFTFSSLSQQGGVLVLPLRSPLSLQPFVTPNVGAATRSALNRNVLLDENAVIAVRQNSELMPLLFEKNIYSVQVDTSQTLELYTKLSRFQTEWEHILINVSEAAIAYTRTPNPPTSAAVATPDLRGVRAALEAPPVTLREVVVAQGQNIWGIAAQYDTTADELQRINCLASPYVNPGHILRLPPEDGSPYEPNCS